MNVNTSQIRGLTALAMSVLAHAGLAVGVHLYDQVRAGSDADLRFQSGKTTQLATVVLRPAAPIDSRPARPAPPADPLDPSELPAPPELPQPTSASPGRPQRQSDLPAIDIDMTPQPRTRPRIGPPEPEPRDLHNRPEDVRASKPTAAVHPPPAPRPPRAQPPVPPTIESPIRPDPPAVASRPQQRGVTSPAKPESEIHPVYPRRAIRKRQQGRVVIHARVQADGTVAAVRVAESSGHDLLDAAAAEAVAKARFRPAVRAGKPVSATVRVPIVFVLR